MYSFNWDNLYFLCAWWAMIILHLCHSSFLLYHLLWCFYSIVGVDLKWNLPIRHAQNIKGSSKFVNPMCRGYTCGKLICFKSFNAKGMFVTDQFTISTFIYYVLKYLDSIIILEFELLNQYNRYIFHYSNYYEFLSGYILLTVFWYELILFISYHKAPTLLRHYYEWQLKLIMHNWNERIAINSCHLLKSNKDDCPHDLLLCLI